MINLSTVTNPPTQLVATVTNPPTELPLLTPLQSYRY